MVLYPKPGLFIMRVIRIWSNAPTAVVAMRTSSKHSLQTQTNKSKLIDLSASIY